MPWAAAQRLRPLIAGVALASVLLSWLAGPERANESPTAESVAFSYPDPRPAAHCSQNNVPQNTAALRTAGGVALTVRAPSNYDPRYSHRLLVVYAPAGMDRHASERFTGLTPVATGAGFLVAYADHKPLNLSVIRDLGSIPVLVAQSWCVDSQRIFLTGHSDGGTVAMALVLSGKEGGQYAGIGPSAAGFTATDLATYQCPAPLAVYVAHGTADELFPNFGRQAAAWWATCNKCAAAPPALRADACLEYSGCAAGARTLYCEHKGRHSVWPAANERLIDFFRRANGGVIAGTADQR
jgi:polyhydroxybutyrate depolymerase